MTKGKRGKALNQIKWIKDDNEEILSVDKENPKDKDSIFVACLIRELNVRKNKLHW